MKTKQTIVVAGILAAGFLVESLVAGEINVKKADGKTVVQVVAGSPEAPAVQAANPNIQVECLKSKDSQTPYPVLKDDLVNAGSPSLAKVLFDDFAPHQACNAAALNDGNTGNPSDQNGVTFDLDGTWTTTFVLDASKASKGYDISEIRTVAGWPPSRAYQKYELLVSKVSAPDKFISMGTFNVDAEGGALASQIKLTGKESLIETNVSSIKFKFMVPNPAVPATETAYREIDVVGKASEK
ncbi:MAG: hypothetical protein WAX69_23035 [Victivallales bacterium]